MRIFWRNAWKIWDDAEFVDHIEPGDYEVKVNLFPRWKDQKHIEISGNCNIDKRGNWGWFSQVENKLGEYLMLCYNLGRNSFFARRIVDHVRCHQSYWGKNKIGQKVRRKSYIGWFGIRILCFWIRISPFTMTKMD